MQISPILRLTFLSAILIIGFFSIILSVNSLSSLNKLSNDLKSSIYKQQMQSVNYRTETERKIDNDVRLNESLGGMDRVNLNNTIKATIINPNTGDNQTKPDQNNPQKNLIGY